MQTSMLNIIATSMGLVYIWSNDANLMIHPLQAETKWHFKQALFLWVADATLKIQQKQQCM